MDNDKLSSIDRTLITGKTEEGGFKQNPEFKPETPYAYPLYKIHSLSSDEIKQRKIPPFRLVYAIKYGPLYRLEKWLSPYLTPLSKEYCEDEYILDTQNLIDQINDINTNDKLNEEHSDNWHLFSIDVKSLCPSISPDLAITALQDALNKCTGMDENLKFSITKMVTFCLSNSFIVYQNNSYKTLKGIPTGGSISQQEADIFLHCLIFIVLSGKIPMWNLIKFWRRYIDDILGIWRGTEQQFKQFISNLNSLTLPYGIKSDKTMIGKSKG